MATRIGGEVLPLDVLPGARLEVEAAEIGPGAAMGLLMDQIQANHLAAIIVEHDLNLVKELSKETIVMCDGEFIARGTPDHVFSQAKVIEILVGKGF